MGRAITLTFDDGRVEQVELKPKHLIAAERALNKPIAEHSIEATYIAAWKASRSALKFDAWLDTVEELTESTEDDDVDPTPPPEPSPDESPT